MHMHTHTHTHAHADTHTHAGHTCILETNIQLIVDPFLQAQTSESSGVQDELAKTAVSQTIVHVRYVWAFDGPPIAHCLPA